jgi:20S proteasome alpha/beta subunit
MRTSVFWNFNNFNIKTFTSYVTLITTGDTTAVWLTPWWVILWAAILVSTTIAWLDSADHHIQLWIAGAVDKYVDVANGSAATSIAKNIKKSYLTDFTNTKETEPLILTITWWWDTTPTSWTVIVEVTYITQDDISNT